MPDPPVIPVPPTHRHSVMLINRNDIFMGQSFLRSSECCRFEIDLLRLPAKSNQVRQHSRPMAKRAAGARQPF
jgi:hypothetical protein